MVNLNKASLPIPVGTVLRIEDEDINCKVQKVKLCRIIDGSAIYIANNMKLDTAYAVGLLTCFMSSSKQRMLPLTKHLLRYLNGTRKLGITNRGIDRNIEFSAYTDAT